MLKRRLLSTLSFLVVGAFGAATAGAQGVTSGGIAGTITDETGATVETAQIQVVNTATGGRYGGMSREGGRYAIAGLEPGGPYTVTVRRIGFTPVVRQNIRVPLGEAARVDVQLTRQAAVLTSVRIEAANNPVITPTKTGASTTISDSALRRLPTLNRNFSDFVQLVPQVSTTTGNLSGGGVNIRQNSIQIDGAASNDLFGLGTTGQPGAQANAKSIPLDAVKEYQVLLAPFDVRQGGFGGLLLNAVTKSGTNDFHGSVYGYSRGQNLTRTQPYLAQFKQQQYGAAIGGPIIRNKLFFYLNGEKEDYRTPTSGPYIGSPTAYVSQASIDQVNNILATQYGFTQGGTGGLVQRLNPKQNVFGRIDAYLPFSTRLVLRHNYAYADNVSFGRSDPTSSSPNFGLTSNAYKFSTKTNASVAEFLSNFSNGVFNELLLNLTKTNDFRTVPAHFPQITVRGVPRTDAATTANLVLGTESSSQGNTLAQRTFELTENLTIPIGEHRITLGTKDQFYRPINLFAQNSLGSWTFSSIDSLNRGLASNYAVSAPSPSDPAHGLATFRANLYTYYIQDAWSVTPNFTLTYGGRLEAPKFLDKPPTTQDVLTTYGRNTADVPTKRNFSPRLSFNWDVTGDQRNQIRGGIGYFTGSPPFVYLSNAFGNSGSSGYVALTCNGSIPSATATTSLQVPAFNSANIASPPTTCAPYARPVPAGSPPGTQPVIVPGATITGPSAGSAVNTIDPNFHFPQYQKISAAYDHRFANGFVSTIEGLYTHSIANVFYQNLALNGPTGFVDRNGRVLYGTLTTTGGTPATHGNRTSVLDASNSSGDYIYSITGTLQKTFSDRFEGSLSYTYSQARDVVSVTSSTAGSNYRYQRDVSGYLTDPSLGRSKNDQPHRIISTGTYRLPTKTDISFIYSGQSGSPYDYVYQSGSGSGSGDLNADGQSQNDLIYVPKDTRNPNEILFTGYNGTPAQQASAAAQAAAFDKFINSVPCLRNSRGRILTRNACRNPWQNEIDISVAQSLEAFHQQNLQLRIDVINFGNLLNPKWGRNFFSDQGSTCGSICSATNILQQTGTKPGTIVGNVNTQQGVFTFDPTVRPYSALNASSNYRMQLSLRYNF